MFNGTTKAPECTKIVAATAATGLFVSHVHRGCDYGALMSFGNTFRVETDFTRDRDSLYGGLVGLQGKVEQACRNGEGEGTRLYDSVADGLARLNGVATPGMPRVLVVVTDGKDNGSTHYRNAPAGAGRAVARRLREADGPCVLFVIGVGAETQIDTAALTEFGRYGGFPILTIAAMPQLADLLATVATTITAQVTRREIRGNGFLIRQDTPELHIEQTPLVYAVLLDRSGSMSENA
jgi:hypothetical protein